MERNKNCNKNINFGLKLTVVEQDGQTDEINNCSKRKEKKKKCKLFIVCVDGVPLYMFVCARVGSSLAIIIRLHAKFKQTQF